jgi:hypothetical protein
MARSNVSKVSHFHTKIVGVTYQNFDGTDRQKLIRNCQVFETLTLDHEEDNPHDENAISVCRENGQRLGYLNAGLAKKVVSKSANGHRFAVFIKEITGGGKGQSLGVNLLVVEAIPGVSDHQVYNYVNDLIKSDPELNGARVREIHGAEDEAGCFGKLVLLVALIAGFVVLIIFLGRK